MAQSTELCCFGSSSASTWLQLYDSVGDGECGLLCSPFSCRLTHLSAETSLKLRLWIRLELALTALLGKILQPYRNTPIYLAYFIPPNWGKTNENHCMCEAPFHINYRGTWPKCWQKCVTCNTTNTQKHTKVLLSLSTHQKSQLWKKYLPKLL